MWIYPAHNKGLNSKLESDLDFRPEKVIETIVNVLRKPQMQKEESTLLLNLVLHFSKTVNFTTYQRLIDDLILVLKEKELSQGKIVPKYKSKIIWKSSTAICKEQASSSKETDFRFYTSQRVALFNAYSVSAMCKAGFEVIDVYSLTDSYPPRCVDHVHYKPKAFHMVETMLEQYKVHYNKKLDENEKHGKIKRCVSTENV
ncbi:uncharacterized protein LOC110052584 [Orbicella faveolata]|uniref:uncharacterized protein LOC110052584 n=1 Tax=Orbicella faveolata TaxID=48498 RepID=UPI0009E6237C|nr:uncharacterized protein LOC110052584 [Orbicella faveolata]